VGHPIPPQAPVAHHSSGADHHGKAPLQIFDVFEEESDDGTDVDAYLNTTMFLT
jgi:hypothetical protein